MFIGRWKEIDLVDNLFLSRNNNAKLIKIDGRRRVGKSFFVRNYIAEKHQLNPENILFINFIGNNTMTSRENIGSCIGILKSFLLNIKLSNIGLYKHIMFNMGFDSSFDLNKSNFQNWNSFFNFLNQLLDFIFSYNSEIKLFLFFDEFAWYDKKGNFLSSFSNCWNLHLHFKKNLFVFLATSVSSWLNKKVNHYDSLYGRFSLDITIKPFSIDEIIQYCKLINPSINISDVIKYYLIFGGIIKYYEYLNLHETYEWNISKLSQSNIISIEKEQLFQSLFGESNPYYEIALKTLCKKKSATFNQIYDSVIITSKKLGIRLPAQNEIRRILSDLNSCHLISIQDQDGLKIDKVFMINDLFSYFVYFWNEQTQFINDFSSISQNYSTWKGNAFEIFVFNNHYLISDYLKIPNKTNTNFYLNWLSKSDVITNKKSKTMKIQSQIDLVMKESYKYETKYRIIECKMYEQVGSSGYRLDLIEEEKILFKQDILKYGLSKNLKTSEVEHLPTISTLVIVFDNFSMPINNPNIKIMSISNFLKQKWLKQN